MEREKLIDKAVRTVMHPKFMKACFNRANDYRLWASGHPGRPLEDWQEEFRHWRSPRNQTHYLDNLQRAGGEAQYAFGVGAGETRPILKVVQQVFKVKQAYG